jgi:hypothetical protein
VLQDVTVEATGTVTDPPPPPPSPPSTPGPGEEPEKRRSRRAQSRAKASKTSGTVSTRRKNEALQQVLVLITAFEEVLAYDPGRQHNQPKPALWIDSPEYLQTVRELLHELRQLNELLQAPLPPKRAASRKAGIIQRGAETFVIKYAATLGVGAATLTLGAVVVLLNSLGLPIDAAIGGFFRKLK